MRPFYFPVFRFLEPSAPAHFKVNRRTSSQGQRGYGSPLLQAPSGIQTLVLTPRTETERDFKVSDGLWVRLSQSFLTFAVHFLLRFCSFVFQVTGGILIRPQTHTLHTHTHTHTQVNQYHFINTPFFYHYFSFSHLPSCLPVSFAAYDEVLHHALPFHFYSVFLNLLWSPTHMHTHPSIADSLSLISRLYVNTASNVEC